MEKEINIPTSLEEITISQYQEYRHFVEQDDLINDGSLEIKTVSIFCNADIDTVFAMKAHEVKEISSEISKLFEVTPESFRKLIKIDGKEYGFIPNLEEISLGELMDCDEFLGKEDELSTLMAILYRPVVKKSSWWRKSKIYSIEDYTTPYNATTMERMSIADAFGALAFLAHLGEELQLSEIDSLSQNPDFPQEISHQLRHLLTDGVGIFS